MAEQEPEIDVQAFEHLIPRRQKPEIDDHFCELLIQFASRRADPRKERVVQSLIAEVIRMVGHDEAIRRIEARRAGGEGRHKTKGKRGRPVGLKYHEMDQQLMVFAAVLGLEWENRGRPRPNHALYTKIVDLCWDREACEIFGMSFDQLGPSKASVVTRLVGRKCFPDEMTSDKGFYALSPTSEHWETVHRARPDLRLLP